MLTRRHFLLCTAMASALLAAGPHAWAQGGDATAFVVRLGNDLTGIINGPGSYEDKKRRLQPFVERSVDVEGIARFCLGLYWRSATPAQQTEFTRLFHDVLMNNIFGKVGEFQGVTFTPTTTTQRDQGTMVGTLIKRPNQQPNNVQWVVNNIGGQFKITDVIAEGVSLKVTQQSDYVSYLRNHGGNVDTLIAAMRQQVGRS